MSHIYRTLVIVSTFVFYNDRVCTEHICNGKLTELLKLNTVNVLNYKPHKLIKQSLIQHNLSATICENFVMKI